MAEQAEGGQVDTGGEAAATTEGGGDDRFDQLTQSFEKFQSDVTSRLDRLAPEDDDEYEEEAEPEERDELDGLEFRFADDDFDREGRLSQDAQVREWTRIAREIAREEAQAAVEPHAAERADDRRMQQADALEQRYPKLQDQEYQDHIVKETKRQAKALGQPALAREPHFLEMVHLMEEARQGAAAEVPAGSTQGATLERGGGAAPADGKSASEEEGDKIVKAMTGQKFRLGS